MKESIYDPYFFYSFGSFGIIKMQTDDILILANDDFVYKEEKAVKKAKIMTKNWKYLTSIQSLKFNRAQIKLDSERSVLIKKSHVGIIFPVTDHDTDFTSSKEITRKKLSPKE